MNKRLDIDYKRFMGHLGHWSWVHLMYRFDASHLIVADFPFIQYLRSVRSEKLQCQVATPDDVDLMKRQGIKKILVFLEWHELPTIRKLQAHYTDAIVCSGTYGYGCVGPNRTPKFAGLAAGGQKLPAPKAVFLSTAYAGAEFIGAAMTAAGMPAPHEYFARPLVRWLDRHAGFQAARFFGEVHARHTSKSGIEPFHLLQMDVLKAMLANSHLSLRHVLKFLSDGGTKIVTLRRHDRIALASEAQLLDHTAERSVWTKKPTKKLANKIEQALFKDCLLRLDALRTEEALLNEIESAMPDGAVYTLTLEEFLKDQADGLQRIARHLGFAAPKDFEPIDFAVGYETAADIGWLTDSIVRQFIDRTGLHHLPVPPSEKQPIKAV